jgi:N utilization substance protein A
MSTDLMRIIDSISRDKNIDRDELVNDIETAMISAIRKNYGEESDAHVKLDLLSGKFVATVDGTPLDVHVLGRIAAQTAKQMIIQKTRERERTSIFADFTERRGTIVTGTVQRVEGGNLIVNIGRTEGFLPRSEQIPGESHQPGERIRVLILEVREQPNQVKIILSRSHPEFIMRLFELEVPEVAEQIIEIRALAREAGYRTKVAVTSIDTEGRRRRRVRRRPRQPDQEHRRRARRREDRHRPLERVEPDSDPERPQAGGSAGDRALLRAGQGDRRGGEDQLSLAIGKRGQNVRLAARLTGWDIDILTPTEYTKHLENLEQVVKSVEGVDDVLVDKLVAFGCVSVMDVDEIGPEPLVKELDLEAELADRVVEAAGEEVIQQEERREAEAKAKAEAEARGETLPASDAGALVAGAAPTEAGTETPTEGAPSAPTAEAPADAPSGFVAEGEGATTADVPAEAAETAAPQPESAATAEATAADVPASEPAPVAEAETPATEPAPTDTPQTPDPGVESTVATADAAPGAEGETTGGAADAPEAAESTPEEQPPTS